MATVLPLSHKMLFDLAIGPIYKNKSMPMVPWKFAIQTGLLLSAVYADAEGTKGAEKIRQGLVKYHT